MKLIQLKNKWDKFGKEDPLWSVLSYPDKKDNKWKQKEFFLTGEREIESIMKKVKNLQIQVKYDRALDFGCGVGRLTQALAKYFRHVYGVDISPSMIHHAKKMNRFGNTCKYLLIQEDNLRNFKNGYFDFIYSNITFQHIEPEYSRHYISELIRILKNDGLLIFQTVSHLSILFKIVDFFEKSTYTKKVFTKFIKINRPMDTYMIPKCEITRIIQSNGAQVVHIENDMNRSSKWVGYFYFVKKIA